MTKYREILRIKSLGLSQQSIADSCNVSKKTVNRVLKRAKELNISWPLDKSNTAYSARTAHPFQRNGAPFHFKLSKAQQVD